MAQYSSSGVRQDRYVQAGVDAPVEMVAGSTTYAYATDGLGSVNRLTDSSGATAETYSYDAWGGTAPSGSVTTPFRFTARTLDSSGLFDYRARSYDPSANGAHRFLSPDPAGGGYADVGDSPANYVDPTGMMYLHPPAGGGGTGATGITISRAEGDNVGESPGRQTGLCSVSFPEPTGEDIMDAWGWDVYGGYQSLANSEGGGVWATSGGTYRAMWEDLTAADFLEEMGKVWFGIDTSDTGVLPILWGACLGGGGRSFIVAT